MGGKRIFVGRLSSRVSERDLERFFRGYGRIREVDLKNGYGFVELESSRDAADAVHDLHGRYLLGDKVSVEMAREPRRTRGGASRYEPPERTEHRLIVENLSSRVTWQNLKDLMRRAGEITYADAHKTHRNEGVVEFASRSDMKRALEKYNGHELFGRRIKLTEDRDGAARRSFSRSRSGSRKGSRSNSRSKKRSRSRSRSRSGGRKRSPSRSRSRKRTVSRSKSHSEKRSRSHSGGRGSRQKRSRSPSEKRSRTGSRSSRSPSRNGDRENGDMKRTNDDGETEELSPKRRRRDSSASQRDQSHSKSRSRSRSRSSKHRKSSEERSRSRSQPRLDDSKDDDNMNSSGSPRMDDSRDAEIGPE